MIKSFNDFILDNEDKLFFVLQNATDIMGQNLLGYYTVLNPIAARYSQVYYSYLFRFCNYVQELSRSLETLHFLSINTIARSALECYGMCKFIRSHLHDNIFSLMKALVFPDLCELKNTIDKYKLDLKKTPQLEEQLQVNQITFYNVIKDYFPNALSWIAVCDNNNQIIEYARNEIKSEEFDNSVINRKTGKLMISNMVSKFLDNNFYYQLIFHSTIQANSIYNLMCSSAHNNYFDSINLFMIKGKNMEFKISCYPKDEEMSNAGLILKILYACFVDLFFDTSDIKYFLLLITGRILG